MSWLDEAEARRKNANTHFWGPQEGAIWLNSVLTDYGHALRLLRDAEDLFLNPEPSELYPSKLRAWRARLQEGPR